MNRKYLMFAPLALAFVAGACTDEQPTDETTIVTETETPTATATTTETVNAE